CYMGCELDGFDRRRLLPCESGGTDHGDNTKNLYLHADTSGDFIKFCGFYSLNGAYAIASVVFGSNSEAKGNPTEF
ncbi:MAG: hypothetical protein WAV20_06890, partial [Blastocatellia bacterium]